MARAASGANASHSTSDQGVSHMRKSKSKDKMHKVMGEYKRGTLHSGSKSGKKVTSRKQAIAIGLSEAGKSRRDKRLEGKEI